MNVAPEDNNIELLGRHGALVSRSTYISRYVRIEYGCMEQLVPPRIMYLSSY